MKVIFDTDPGIDDAMALLYLNACLDIELLGITTILGNATLDDCTRNALFLCEQFGVDAPVYRGAETAINGVTPADYPDFVHGGNGLGDLTFAIHDRKIENEDAATYLIESTRKLPGEITLLAVGRLTNIALAIQRDHEFSSNVREIILMGGACNCEGNVTPYAEANIIGDPEAAEVVFRSSIPLVMVGLDVTMQTCFTMDYLKSACVNFPEPLTQLILDINRVYAEYHKTNLGWDQSPVHDSSAIAYADQPDCFKTDRGTLTCVLEGEQRGRTVFKADEEGDHLVCSDVASEKLLNRYQQVIGDKYSIFKH